MARHTYCISSGYIRHWLSTQKEDAYIPRDLHPVCNHPEDGWCATGMYPTDEELKEINLRLGGGEKPTEREKTVVVRKKREPKPPEPKKYFCLNCEDWHFEDDHNGYTSHMKFKRGRGRPKK